MPHPDPDRLDASTLVGTSPGEFARPRVAGHSPDDPAVTGRRALHRAAAAGCAQALPMLHVAFALAGCLLVLLPALSPPWRALLASLPAVGALSNDYGALGTSARLHVAVLLAAWVARTAVTLPSADAERPTGFDEIVARGLYPRTRREEIAFWIDIVQSLTATSLWLLMPFGVLAAIVATVLR